MSVYPNNYNVYQPSLESSGKLMVDFSRNPAKFPVVDYAQIIKVEKNAGLYIRHTPDEAARALGASGDQWIWADGAASPDNYIQKEFEFPSYVTRRYVYPFSLGDLTVEQAAWDIVANYSATSAAIAMTQRTRKAMEVLQDTGVIPNATGTALGGGQWNAGNNTTAGQAYLRIGIMTAVQQILMATNGVVGPSDLMMIINPTDARKLASCIEVIDFVKQSPFSVENIKAGGNFSIWGLPDYLFGVKVVVEDCVVVTSKKGAARANQFALTAGNIPFVSKVGGLETTNGTFSSLGCFMKEEMTVETYADALNRRMIGRVVEDYQYQLTSPISSILVTAAVS